MKRTKRIGSRHNGIGNFEVRVVSSVRHSERSSEIRLKIGSLASVTGAMIFCWAISVKRWGKETEAIVKLVRQWRWRV